MSRALFLLLCLAAAAAAQSYEEILEEAVRLERDLQPGEPPDLPIERAYVRLADAAQLEPDRWEAFALRGTNRCTKAVTCRDRLGQLLSEARARGEPAGTWRAKEQAGLVYIDQCIAAGRHDFAIMERNMRARGEVDRKLLRFAAAALKYARGEYLRAAEGRPGAIADFEELARSGWRAEQCSEFVARCYVQLGVAAVHADDSVAAQAYWEKALRWARAPSTRRLILSNQAAAYYLDNEFGMAEAIVRRQVEMEPSWPLHWKNLGLMLGHENRLRAALRAYARARELCGPVDAPIPLGSLHGNAWLKAAMIHGKLLEEDGDLRLAWRLFLEYRRMLGDDYNFCVNFGEFAFHMGRYDLAWRYLRHARDLRPFCVMPYQLLLMTALRMGGPVDEAKERVAAARDAHNEALRRFQPREESTALKRLCGGITDRTEVASASEPPELLEPDPLAGLAPDHPPAWLEAAAATRRPFQPDLADPEPDPGPALPDRAGGSGPGDGQGNGPGPVADGGGGISTLWILGAAALVLAAFAAYRRLRA